jgi:hypothetical protein
LGAEGWRAVEREAEGEGAAARKRSEEGCVIDVERRSIPEGMPACRPAMCTVAHKLESSFG